MEDSLPPYTNSYFLGVETQNSNPRFIRSTYTHIPSDPLVISSSGLPFGIVVQPFAELKSGEEPIPIVEVPNGIFRCKRCSSYINNKYKIDYNKQSKRVAICNLCNCEIEIDSNNPTVKQEYLNNYSKVPELNIPTIDYLAPNSMIHSNQFEPHYLFMFDVSQLAIELAFPSYIINSIQSTLDLIHNAEGSKVAFGTYDSKSVKFYWVDKSDVKIAVVPDIERPFCPIPKSKLFLNVIKQREEIEKIIERLINNVATKDPKNTNINGSVCGAAIKSGIEALTGNGGRVILFNCSSCTIGFGSTKIKDERLITNPEKEKSLYAPQDKVYQVLSEKCNTERITVDLFSIGNSQFDFATFSQISSFTGGHASYYAIDPSQNDKGYNQNLEKIHYELARILTRPNYYDVKFMLRNSIGVEISEIIGQFGKKVGQGFAQASMDPDSCFSYSLRHSEKLKGQKLNFQLVCMFIDNYNKKYLRLFNLAYFIESDISKVYVNVDVDTMTKHIIHKELLQFYNHSLEKLTVKENLINRIINFLYYYRINCSKTSPIQQLILPANVKFIPMFLTSLFKKVLLRKNKDKLTSNEVLHYLLKIMREPIRHTIKNLYPKFYRIDDILEDQSDKVDNPEFIYNNIGLLNENYGIIQRPYSLPLSLDYIDMDCKFILKVIYCRFIHN